MILYNLSEKYDSALPFLRFNSEISSSKTSGCVSCFNHKIFVFMMALLLTFQRKSQQARSDFLIILLHHDLRTSQILLAMDVYPFLMGKTILLSVLFFGYYPDSLGAFHSCGSFCPSLTLGTKHLILVDMTWVDMSWHFSINLITTQCHLTKNISVTLLLANYGDQAPIYRHKKYKP